MKPFYNKPAKTLDDQAQLLLDRGLKDISKTNIVTPTCPATLPNKWLSLGFAQSKVYSSICIIKRLLDYSSPDFDFMGKFTSLMAGTTEAQKRTMGFPVGWESEALFN